MKESILQCCGKCGNKKWLAALLVLVCLVPLCALAANYETSKRYTYTDPSTNIKVVYLVYYQYRNAVNDQYIIDEWYVTPRKGQRPAGSITIHKVSSNGWSDPMLTHAFEEYEGAAADTDCTKTYGHTYSLSYGGYRLVRESSGGHTWSDWEESVSAEGVTQYTRRCVHPVCTIEETYLLDVWTSNGDGFHSRVVLNEGVPVPVLETEACQSGTATCTHLALCDACGGEHGEVNPDNHSFTTVYTSHGDGTHSQVCDYDATHISPEKSECTEFEAVDNKDYATHSRCCVNCGYASMTDAEHWTEVDDGTCFTPVLCQNCDGIVVPARTEHVFEDGVCLYCEEREKYLFTYMDGDTVLGTETVTSGSVVYLMIAEDRDGLTFVGWDVDGDGEEDYIPGAGMYAEEPTTFCAVYKRMCTITFYEYDGEQDVYYDGYQVSVPAGEMVSLGEQYSYWYKFAGWATEPRGKVVYPAGEMAAFTGNVSLYAIVQPYSATINLNAEDAYYVDAAGKPITVLHGEMPYSWLYITDFPVRPGYYFLGFIDDSYYASEWTIWTDEETGEEYIEISLNSDITLTAMWEECTEHILNGDGECVCGYACPHDCANGSVCSLCNARVNRSQLTLPDDLTEVGAEAFLGTAEEAVLVPAGVTSIGSRAFGNSRSLRAVIFAGANATIASDALSGSFNAVIVAPAGGTVEAWANANGVTFVEAK